MLKPSPIFERNGAHLVFKKGHLKKTRIVHSWNLNVFNMQKHFLFLSNFEHVNFAINQKYSKRLWQSKLLCFPCDLSNIQKCNFKECPCTWVALLMMFLPLCCWSCTRLDGISTLQKWTIWNVNIVIQAQWLYYNFTGINWVVEDVGD
jgi:hypothetical protein